MTVDDKWAYKHDNPEIQKLLDELGKLQEKARSLANLITSQDYANETEQERTIRQQKQHAVADTYAFCRLRIMMLKL